MQANLETLSGLKRRLTIAIPVTEVEPAVEARLQRVARQAKIQGFRPGKAPLKLVAQQHGPEVREEVLTEAVNKAFAEAVQTNSLQVAGYPEFLPVEGEAEAVSFTATFEVYPEFTVGDVSGKEIERPVCEVTEAEIDRTLEVLRKQRTRFEHVERAAEQGDRVIVAFKGTIEGEAFSGGTAENYPVMLGQGQMLPEFEAAIVGASAGETKTASVTFPEDYHGKDVAGKTAQFDITVKAVSASQLPELDAEFARSIGIEDGNVEKMRAEIAKNVGREVSRRLKSQLKENVMKVLDEVTPIEVPEALVQLEIGRLMEQAKEDLASRGMDPKMIPSLPAQLFQDQAARRVRLGLILAELVKVNELSAKPEQVKAVVEEFAESYEHPEDVVKWYYADPRRLEAPESLALEDNVVEFVLAKATSVDKPVEFEALMGNA